MAGLKCLGVLVLLLIAVHPSFADNNAKLVGPWKVISFETEYQSGQRDTVLGKNPIGYSIYSPDGRTMSVATASGLKPATTDQERANLWKSIIAWSGTYRAEGDKLITRVDVSSMPSLLGTERVATFRIEGDRLQTVPVEWADSPLYPERGKMRTVVTMQRVK